MPATVVKPHVTHVRDLLATDDRRVRRRAIGRPLIFATAIELIDEQGIRACTMQALATRLGVTPRALYRHVADKDNLLRGVAQVVLSEMALPDGDWPPRARLRHAGFELRRVLRAHPHAAALCFAHRSSVFPAVIPVTDAIIAALRDVGLPDETGIRFAHALANYTLGYSMAETDYDLHPNDGAVADPLGGITPELVPRVAANTAFLLRFANDGLHASDEQFAFGLDLMLDGLELRSQPAASVTS